MDNKIIESCPKCKSKNIYTKLVRNLLVDDIIKGEYETAGYNLIKRKLSIPEIDTYKVICLDCGNIFTYEQVNQDWLESEKINRKKINDEKNQKNNIGHINAQLMSFLNECKSLYKKYSSVNDVQYLFIFLLPNTGYAGEYDSSNIDSVIAKLKTEEWIKEKYITQINSCLHHLRRDDICKENMIEPNDETFNDTLRFYEEITIKHKQFSEVYKILKENIKILNDYIKNSFEFNKEIYFHYRFARRNGGWGYSFSLTNKIVDFICKGGKSELVYDLLQNIQTSTNFDDILMALSKRIYDYYDQSIKNIKLANYKKELGIK